MGILNEYNVMNKLLSSEGGYIRLNKKLIQNLGLEATCVFSELLNMQIEAIKKDDWQLIDNLPFFSVSTDKLSVTLGISAHKQRSILQYLQEKELIHINYGNGNLRMLHVVSNYYILNDIINPSSSYSEVLYKHLADNVNNLKKILFNINSEAHRLPATFEQDFYTYLSKNSNEYNSYDIEKGIFEILNNKTFQHSLQNERSKMCS